MIRVGIIGYGHWGPNHARVFRSLPECRLVAIADSQGGRLEAARRTLPDVTLTADFHAVLQDPGIDAVVVSTPLVTHFAIVKEALEAGKDVLVEKPICYTVREADELIELAESARPDPDVWPHLPVQRRNPQAPGIHPGRDTRPALLHVRHADQPRPGPPATSTPCTTSAATTSRSSISCSANCPKEVTAWGESYLQTDVEDVDVRLPRVLPAHLWPTCTSVG